MEMNKRRNVYLETYGCQMNVADSDLMLGLLDRGGYARTDDPADADLILINTCAVREKAEERVFARASERGLPVAYLAGATAPEARRFDLIADELETRMNRIQGMEKADEAKPARQLL